MRTRQKCETLFSVFTESVQNAYSKLARILPPRMNDGSNGPKSNNDEDERISGKRDKRDSGYRRTVAFARPSRRLIPIMAAVWRCQ